MNLHQAEGRLIHVNLLAEAKDRTNRCDHFDSACVAGVEPIVTNNSNIRTSNKQQDMFEHNLFHLETGNRQRQPIFKVSIAVLIFVMLIHEPKFLLLICTPSFFPFLPFFLVATSWHSSSTKTSGLLLTHSKLAPSDCLWCDTSSLTLATCYPLMRDQQSEKRARNKERKKGRKRKEKKRKQKKRKQKKRKEK